MQKRLAKPEQRLKIWLIFHSQPRLPKHIFLPTKTSILLILAIQGTKRSLFQPQNVWFLVYPHGP